MASSSERSPAAVVQFAVEGLGSAAGGPDGSSGLNLAVSVDLAVHQLWAENGALGIFLRTWLDLSWNEIVSDNE